MITLVLFVALGFAYRLDSVERIDRQILLSMRNGEPDGKPLGPAWMPDLVRFLTHFGGWGGLIPVTVIGMFALKKQNRPGKAVLHTILTGVLLMIALKALFGRPRPDFLPHLRTVKFLAYPSGHAMLSLVVFAIFWLTLTRQSGLLLRRVCLAAVIVMVFVIGCTRVYLGVHYPTDVVGGWLFGTSWLLFCVWLAEHPRFSSRQRINE